MATSTSFRISDTAKARLASRAAREAAPLRRCWTSSSWKASSNTTTQASSFRGPAHDRRAALAAGPDVWEVIARLQELDGTEEQRVAVLGAESELHPRLIRLALDYAAEHPDEIGERTDANRATAQRSRIASRQREALLA